MTRRERRKIALEEYRRQKKARREAQKRLGEEKELEGFKVEEKDSISNSKSAYKTIEEEQNGDQESAIAYLQIMQRFMPILLKRLSKVADFRNPKKVKHKIAVIILFGIFCFVFQKVSRREANREMTTPIFIENLKIFFPDLDSLPHHDTINRFLSWIDIKELEEVHIELIRQFIRSKKFVKYLIGNCYPIAIDGTQKYSYDFLWANECQRRNVDGKMQYYCYCSEASLAFKNGMVIPLATEFLEFTEGDVNSDKQDCELKAFKRLSKKIKDYFPRLNIMVLLDGLYPNGEIMEICRRYGCNI